MSRPAGKQVNFNGRPLAVPVSPDQKTAVLLATGSNGAGKSLLPVEPVVVVDLATATIKQSFTTTDTNGSYDGLVYSPDGAHLYFSQDDGVITIANVAGDDTLTLNTQIKLPTDSPSDFNRSYPFNGATASQWRRQPRLLTDRLHLDGCPGAWEDGPHLRRICR